MIEEKDIVSVTPLLPNELKLLSASLVNDEDNYLQQLCFELTNSIDASLIEKAIAKLVKKYEALRSILLHENLDTPVWVVLKQASILESHDRVVSEKEFERIKGSDQNKKFDFQKKPLIRISLLNLDNTQRLILTYHHILFDGLGRQRILADFIGLLNAHAIDMTVQQVSEKYDYFKSLNQVKALNAYQSYINRDITGTSFCHLGYENESRYSVIEVEIKKPLYSKGSYYEKLTDSEFFLFQLSIFVHAIKKTANICLGHVKQTGLLSSSENTFGLGIQVLPFESSISFDKSFSSNLKNFIERERSIADYSYVDPGNEIFSGKDYKILYVFENYPILVDKSENSLGIKLNDFTEYSEFPVVISITPEAGSFKIRWQYNAKFFLAEQITYYANLFKNFLNQGHNPNESTLNELINRIAFKESKVFEVKSFQFQQELENIEANYFRLSDLEDKIDQETAHQIKSSLIRNRVKVIWLVGDKSASHLYLLIACLLLKIKVYLVNQNESEEYLESLFGETLPDIIYSENNLFAIDTFTLKTLINLNSNVNDPSSNESTQNPFIGFSSTGTTGKAKIIHISISQIFNFFSAWDKYLAPEKNDVFAAIAHPAFDIGVAELLYPLSRNLEMRLIPLNYFSDDTLLLNHMQKVSCFHMVPQLLERYLNALQSSARHRVIMTGGDKVPPHLSKLASKKSPGVTFFQFYGPTEATILTSAFKNTGNSYEHQFPLGNSFSHCEYHISGINESIPFETGEIIIYGPSVTEGYPFDKAMSKAKFFKHNNFSAFRSGDSGYIDHEGNLFFIGRKDNNFKINGQMMSVERIEEALTLTSPSCKWIVVHDKSHIGAAYIADNGGVDTNEVQAELSKHLPLPAVPALFHKYDKFPLNKNGKIDRNQIKKDIEKLRLKSKARDSISLQKNRESFSLLFPNKNLDFTASWYANGLNSIDILRYSGMLFKQKGIKLNRDNIVYSTSLDEVFEQADRQSQIEKYKEQVVKIGDYLNENASRLAFLSESDDKLNESYWIYTGFKLDHSKEINYSTISNWFSNQEVLHFAIQPEENKYKWNKSKEFGTTLLKVKSEEEFINQVEQSDHDFFRRVCSLYYAQVGPSTLIAIKTHHSFLDGLNIEILWKAMLSFIDKGKSTKLKYFEQSRIDSTVDFWNSYLENAEVQRLPFQKDDSFSNYDTKVAKFTLNPNQLEIIEQVQKHQACSTFESLLILWSKLFKTYYPKSNFTTGIPVNISSSLDDEHLSTMSVNTLPYRITSTDEKTILESWKTLLENKDVDLANLKNKFNRNSEDGHPLFNTLLSYINIDTSDSLEFKPLEFKRKYSHYPLSLEVVDSYSGLSFNWEYNPNLFSEASIRKIHNNLFCENEIINHSEVSLAIKNLINFWEVAVKENQDKAAIIFEEQTISFSELNSLVVNLSEKLNTLQVETLIVLMDRSINAVAIILACFLSKVTIVPIDSENPKEVVHRIEQAIGITAVYSENKLDDLTRATNKSSFSDANNLLYGISTSGSTGAPKIVGITESNYCAALEAWLEDYSLSNSEVILSSASFSFDVSMGDIGRSLLLGNTLVLAGKYERKDPDALLNLISKHQVTVYETTPFFIRWWKENNKLDQYLMNLKLLIVGSDTWQVEEFISLNNKLPKTKVINSYGLTETTIDNAFLEVSELTNHYSKGIITPLGKAMKHTQLQIVNEYGNPVRDGIIGYLQLSGYGVGYGYFMDNQWSLFNNTFQTNDLAFKDETGIFHFVGRDDSQVKIRGQRIELAAVEAALTSLSPGIEWCAVSVKNEISTELVAFYDRELTGEEVRKIRGKLRDNYPLAYTPTHMFEIPQIPYNNNGKRDTKSLVKIAAEQITSLQETATPQDNSLVDFYNNMFLEQAKSTDNFFTLGKSSFDIMRFVREWNNNHELHLSVQHAFSAESFDALTTFLAPVNLKYDNFDNRTASLAEEGIWFEIKSNESSMYNLPHFIDVSSFKDPNLIIDKFFEVIASEPNLHVTFIEDELGNLLKTYQALPVAIEKVELELSKSEYEAFKEKSFFKEFDFEKGPLYETAIIKTNNKIYLYFNPHHIIYDGGSDQFLFDKILGVNPTANEQNEIFQQESNSNDWEEFFSMAPLPKKIFQEKLSSLGYAINQILPDKSAGILKDLQKQYSCSLSVLFSSILGELFQREGLDLPWLSLMIDTRSSTEVGMYMRSFPFPASNGLFDKNIINIQKKALGFLFGKTKERVIYPSETERDSFMQVGLIIQHPIQVTDYDIQQEPILTRPRLPLTLYVELIQDKINLRWEFMENCFDRSFIQKSQKLAMSIIEEMRSLPDPGKPSQFQSTKHSLEKSHITAKDPKLTKIWNKYTQDRKYDDFFMAGGNSLKALRLVSDIKNELEANIAVEQFFRHPRYSFLHKQINARQLDYLSLYEQLTWTPNTTTESHEVLLFPPILGYGYIFNSLNTSKAALAFNYPAAIDLDSPTTIEEIADLLFNVYTTKHKPPSQLTLVGYSMGALIAYEFAKKLEQLGKAAANLVVLDKSVHVNQATNAHGDKELKEELLEIIKQIKNDDQDEARLKSYMKLHEQAIDGFLHTGKLNCNIELYLCDHSDRAQQKNLWKQFTTGLVSMTELNDVTHYEIPNVWNNLDIFRSNISV